MKVWISMHIRVQTDADSRCRHLLKYSGRQRGPGSACAKADLYQRVLKLHKGPFRAFCIICCCFLITIIYVEISTHSLEVYIFGEKHFNVVHANKEFCIVLYCII